MKLLYRALSVFALIFTLSSSLKSQDITFSELNYNSDSTLNSGNWVELYNFGTTSLDISGWTLKNAIDLNIFTIPPATILASGERLVVVSDIPRFTSQYPFVTKYIGTMPFTFGNDGDQVRLFDNTGILKVFMEYADSTPWPTAVDGTGRTLELLDPSQSPDSASNWFAGCMGGSPGTAFIPCNDPIVFDEINYNSDTLSDAGDWVELWNHSSGYINLTGWTFKDSHDGNFFDLPTNMQLAPDARLVLVHDTARFFSRHPNVTNWAGPFAFNLSNDGELIRLFDFNGKLKFSIVYNDHGGWPSGADGDGYTLELLNADGNMNDAADWFTGCPEGSAGYAYTPNCNVGISTVTLSHLQILNNVTNHSVILEVPEADFKLGEKLSVFNLYGEEVLFTTLDRSYLEINVSNMPPGLYFVRIGDGKHFLTGKFIVP